MRSAASGVTLHSLSAANTPSEVGTRPVPQCFSHKYSTDRSEQRAFTINRVTVGPAPYKLGIPKNCPLTIPFTAKAGPGTTARNLRLVLDAASQPTGQRPAGVLVQPAAPVSLAERHTLKMQLVFGANNEAQPSGNLILDVVSDEHPAPSGQVSVNDRLAEARPFLVATPSFVETGIVQGGRRNDARGAPSWRVKRLKSTQPAPAEARHT